MAPLRNIAQISLVAKQNWFPPFLREGGCTTPHIPLETPNRAIPAPMQAIIVHSYPWLRQTYHIGQVNLPDQHMLRLSLGCLLNIKSSCWSPQKNISGKFKRWNFFPVVSRILFWMFLKIKDELADIIYVCQFVHVSLSSTQFSSDQIQNGGVKSDGWRTTPILVYACATMCQWNLTWCEGFYCLLWRTSARHKGFIHRICKNISTFYQECTCSPDWSWSLQ